MTSKYIRDPHVINKYHKREPFMSYHNDGVQNPFVAPLGFEDVQYTIKNDIPVPVVRRNQIPPDFSQNYRNQNYVFPIHKKETKTYNLLCTLDKMKVGEHIEIKGKDYFTFANSTSALYAIRIRSDKKADMKLRFRGAYDSVLNIGRIWRIS